MTKVLVVDDEGPVRSAVKRMLGQHGFEVSMASSYDEALQLLQKVPFEVLLTDLRMNGPDGLELIRATQASSPATRPILMSAYATARDSQMALDLGAVRVLGKPFEPNELLEAVRRAADTNEGFFGAVHGLSLIDLLQMFHYMRRSITVRLLGAAPVASDFGGSSRSQCHGCHGRLARRLRSPAVTERARPPLVGFNNNFRYRGLSFHIQTEDSGVERPHIITHLFVDGGRVIKTLRNDYSEHVNDPGYPTVVQRMMRDQHRAMAYDLRQGRIDPIIDGLVAGGAALPSQRHEPTPTLSAEPTPTPSAEPTPTPSAEPKQLPSTGAASRATAAIGSAGPLPASRTRRPAAGVAARAGRELGADFVALPPDSLDELILRYVAAARR